MVAGCRDFRPCRRHGGVGYPSCMSSVPITLTVGPPPAVAPAEADANVTDLRPGEAIRYYEQRHARGKVVITV
jgi:hypothetical protein